MRATTLAAEVVAGTGITPAIATIVVAVVTVLGSLAGAAVSYWLNRNNNSADTAGKISQAWVPVFQQYDTALEQVQKQCDDCRTQLRKANERADGYELRLEAAEKRERIQTRALETLVRVYDRNDPIEVEAAIGRIRLMLAG